MRLLFLSAFYPPLDRGGLDQMCHEVVTLLQQRGHTIQVLTSRYGVVSDAGYDDTAIRSLHLQADINYYSVRDFFLKRPAQEQANARELRQAIDGLAPDVIVVWNMWNLTRSLPYWAERWMPGRVAYYISATWLSDTDIHIEYWQSPAHHHMGEWLKRPLRALALSQLRREGYPPQLRLEHAVCVSRFVYEVCVQTGKLPPSAGVLYAGIRPEPFLQNARDRTSAPTRPLRLVYTGALLRMKGVHTAIEAMRILKERNWAEHLELTLIGSGHPDYEAYLHKLVDQYELADRVRFVGRVTRDEIPQCLSQHDVFLFTSSGPEALARSVMEAMAAGLLVIGAETGGQIEMFDNGHNALTFTAEDAVGLANQIERALLDPMLCQRLARAGQRTVLERFTLRRMIDDLEVWLQQIIHENPASQRI